MKKLFDADIENEFFEEMKVKREVFLKEGKFVIRIEFRGYVEEIELESAEKLHEKLEKTYTLWSEIIGHYTEKDIIGHYTAKEEEK